MQVYLIVEWVDLGYHVKKVFLSKTDAIQELVAMTIRYKDTKINELMANCNYTREQADIWFSQNNEIYSLEEIEVQE